MLLDEGDRRSPLRYHNEIEQQISWNNYLDLGQGIPAPN